MILIFHRALLHLKHSRNSNILIQIYKNCAHKDIGMLEAFGVVTEFYQKSKRLEDSDRKTKLAGEEEALEMKRMDSIQSERLLKKFAEKFTQVAH